LKISNKNIHLSLLTIFLFLTCCTQTLPLMPGPTEKTIEKPKNTSPDIKKETTVTPSPEIQLSPTPVISSNNSGSVQVKNIIIDIASLTLLTGKNSNINAEVNLENGEKNTAIEWVSSDNTIVSVNNSGKVNALKKGVATVRAISLQDPTKFAQCLVTVEDLDSVIPVIVVIENKGSDTSLNIGKTLQLEAFVKYTNGTVDDDFSWSSSDLSVISVNKSGLITALKKGIVKITAISNKENKISSFLEINVTDDSGLTSPGTGSGVSSSFPPHLTLLQQVKNEVLNYYSLQRGPFILSMNGDGSNLQKIDYTAFSNSFGFEMPILSANKENIVYLAGTNEGIYTANSDGSDRRRIFHPPGTLYHVYPKLSPDGLKVTFQVGGTAFSNVYIADFDGHNFFNVTNRNGCDFPSFSPDGKRIVYTTENNTLETINSDGSDPKVILENKVVALPIWSPDGKRIAFRLYEGFGTFNIYSINIDGTNLTNLTKFTIGTNISSQPNMWSSDSKNLFYEVSDNGKDDLYVVSASTLEKKIIPFDMAKIVDCCTKLTGKMLVHSDLDGTNKMYVIKPDGKNKVKVTDFNPEYSRLSPNRDLVMYTDADGLYTVKSDGTDIKKIPNTDHETIFPAWSFDTQIGFTKATGTIFIASLSGDGPFPLPLANPKNGYMALSNDNKKLAYSSIKNNETDLNIYKFNFDTGEQTQLTDSTYNSYANWSPDSSKIVFESDRTGRKEIYIMDADGSNETQLTTFGAYHPNWGPVGQKIAFSSEKDGKSAIYVMNPDGTGIVKIMGSNSHNYILESWQ
jgi:Tol biopolymer transport system component/uncharacterized protein YjdB